MFQASEDHAAIGVRQLRVLAQLDDQPRTRPLPSALPTWRTQTTTMTTADDDDTDRSEASSSTGMLAALESAWATVAGKVADFAPGLVLFTALAAL